jgi:alkyl sulfatase BDS1-like metallo-beta-lactamase superfamily hydrolase
MSTQLFLDFLGIRLDSQKAAGVKFTLNLLTPDNGEKFVVEMSNSTLTNINGFQAKNPDLTITINRSDLELIMAGITTFPALIGEGKAKLEGDLKPFEQLRSLLVEFTLDFEIMPGTHPEKAAISSEKDPFEQLQPADTSGG